MLTPKPPLKLSDASELAAQVQATDLLVGLRLDAVAPASKNVKWTAQTLADFLKEQLGTSYTDEQARAAVGSLLGLQYGGKLVTGTSTPVELGWFYTSENKLAAPKSNFNAVAAAVQGANWDIVYDPLAGLARVAATGDYNDLVNKPPSPEPVPGGGTPPLSVSFDYTGAQQTYNLPLHSFGLVNLRDRQGTDLSELDYATDYTVSPPTLLVKAGINIVSGKLYATALFPGAGNTVVTEGANVGTFVPQTHAQLVALQQAGTLVPNTYYIITDYQTIYVLPGSANTVVENGVVLPQTTLNYGGGNVTENGGEQLVVFAITPNQLSPRVFSLAYPADELDYDITPQPIGNGQTDKGRILRRREPQRNVETFFDFRTAKVRRYRCTGLRSTQTLTISGDTARSSSNRPADNNNALFIIYRVTGAGATVPVTKIQYLDGTSETMLTALPANIVQPNALLQHYLPYPPAASQLIPVTRLETAFANQYVGPGHGQTSLPFLYYSLLLDTNAFLDFPMFHPDAQLENIYLPGAAPGRPSNVLFAGFTTTNVVIEQEVEGCTFLGLVYRLKVPRLVQVLTAEETDITSPNRLFYVCAATDVFFRSQENFDNAVILQEVFDVSFYGQVDVLLLTDKDASGYQFIHNAFFGRLRGCYLVGYFQDVRTFDEVSSSLLQGFFTNTSFTHNLLRASITGDLDTVSFGVALDTRSILLSAIVRKRTVSSEDVATGKLYAVTMNGATPVYTAIN